MIIIGEKLNGSIPSVAEAIAKRDEAFIRQRAIDQTKAGATYLDVCASVPEKDELDTLKWMLEIVQDASDLPICIDSPSPNTCVAAMEYVKKPGMLNSVSMEGKKTEIVLPAIAGTTWSCVGLLCSKGIPKSAQERLDVFDALMEECAKYSIAPDRMHIDPLVEMLCTAQNGVNMVIDVIREVKHRCPTVHVTGAASNVSFNLPVRKILNQSFLTLAMAAGMDSAVMDPCNRDMMGLVYATEAMLGKDMFCMNYIGAYRKNLFGPVK